MGIQGLLKALQPYSEKSSIRKFANQSLAVDASSWLHKSVYSISAKYVEASERSRTALDPSCVKVSTSYMQRRCQELFSSASIGKIYLVFDGKRCPLKAAENNDREERRNKNLKDARLYKKQGRRDKAEEKYKMCIKIHAAFADAVAEALQKVFARDSRLICVFSPYEADAQLAKLCVDGIADAIITEDSDVLVYSASCHVPMPIIYKLDRHSGVCDVVSMDWLICATNENRPPPSKNKKGGAIDAILLSLADRQTKRPGLGVRLFVQACVLAGSDYSPSKLNGVGLVTAFKLLRDNAHRSCNERYRFLLDGLTKKNKGTEDMVAYEELLAQSEAVFYHHPVLGDKNIVTLLTAPRFSNEIVDGPSDYHPLLERFEGDLWFLGDIEASLGAAPQLPDSPMTHATMFPVKEIVVKTMKRKRDTVEDKSSKRKRDDDKGSTEAQRLVQSVKNPYKSTSKLFDNITNVKELSNPFENFAHGKQAKNDGYSTYVNKRTDLRFTKRKFTKDGKPVNPNYKRSTSEIVKPAPNASSRQGGVRGVRSGTVSSARVSNFSSETAEPDQIDLTADEVLGVDIRSGDVIDNRVDLFANEHIDPDESFMQHPDPSLDFVSPRVDRLEEDECLPDVPPTRDSFPSYHSNHHYDSRFERDLEDVGEPDERTAKPSFFKSNSLTRATYDSISPEQDEFGLQTSASFYQTFDQPDDDGVESKYFARSGMNARRVTLESPEPPLNDFEHTGTYVNLESSPKTPHGKPASPGGDSVISEVDEFEAQFEAATIPYKPTTATSRYSRRTSGNEIGLTSETPIQSTFSRRSIGSSAMSNSTPFQNNFNPIQRHGSSRPRSRNQPTLFDVWDQNSVASSMKSRAQPRKQKNRITSYFGYQSVVAERDDGDFLGL